jgi:hypothetical protein
MGFARVVEYTGHNSEWHIRVWDCNEMKPITARKRLKSVATHGHSTSIILVGQCNPWSYIHQRLVTLSSHGCNNLNSLLLVLYLGKYYKFFLMSFLSLIPIWIFIIRQCKHSRVFWNREKRETENRERIHRTWEQHTPLLARYVPWHGSQCVTDNHHQSSLKPPRCKMGQLRHPAKWFRAHKKIGFLL